MQPESMLKVFVSYSRTDQAFAATLVEALGRRDFDAYLDTKDIAPGEPWQERLGQLIAIADTVVFVLSADSIASPVCAWEIDEAERLNKRILPVVCRMVEPGKVPGRLRRLNWISFADTPQSTADVEAALARLAEALLTDIVWIREHTRLGEIAGRWSGQGQRDDLLMRGQALAEAELWISRRPREAPEPSELHRSFILDSRRAEVQRSMAEHAQLYRERRLQRRWWWALGTVGVLVLAGLASSLWQSRSTFEREARVLTTAAAVALKDGRPDHALRLAVAGLPPAGAVPALTPWSDELEAQLAEAARNNSLQRVIKSGTGTFDELVLNADGTRALALEEGRLRLWDTASSRLSAELEGRHGHLWRAAFSPDRARVVVQTQPDLAELFDAVNGRRLERLEGHTGQMTSLAFSADGAFIAIGSDDGTARLWDGRTGAPGHILRGHIKSIDDVAFSGNGARLATASSDATASVWDVRAGTAIVVVTHLGMIDKPYPINRVALNRDGSRLATTSLSFSNQLRLWDVATGQNVAQQHGHNNLMVGLRFSPDGSLLASSDLDRNLQMWDARTGAQVWLQQLAAAGDSNLAFSPDGQLLVVDAKAMAQIRDAHSGAPLAALRGHEGALRQLAFTPDGSNLVTTGEDRTARVWHLETAGRVAVMRLTKADAIPIPPPPGTFAGMPVTGMLPVFAPNISGVDISRDGASILTASESRTVLIHDIRSASRRLVLAGADSGFFDAAFSPDGARALASGAAKVWVWNARTGVLETVLEGHGGVVRSAMFSPDGTRILTASNDKTVRLWDALSGRELSIVTRHDDGVAQAVFSADGTHIATAGMDRTIKIIELASGTQTQAFKTTESVLSVAFTPNGRRLAAAVKDNILIWDLATSEQAAVLRGHRSTVWRVRFNADGSRLATGGSDTTVRLWDVETWTELATLSSFEGEVRHLAFVSSGPRLVAASGASAAVIDLSSMALHRKGGLRDHVCGELLRDDGARSFSAHEMADPILRGRDDLANPCRRRGPLALDYWIRLPGELWSWSGARSTRIAVDGLRGAQMPQATDRHVVR